MKGDFSMRTLTKTGIRMLSAKYRSILIKCAIINASVFIGAFGAGSAMAEGMTWSDLKNAVDTAASGATINISNSIISNGEGIGIWEKNNITLQGVDVIFLNGDNQYIGFELGNGKTAGFTNISFNNFAASEELYAGAITNIQSILNITDSDFNDNSALSGGAVFNYEGTTNITADNKDVVFSQNNASLGGAIYNSAQGTVGLYANSNRSITFVGGTGNIDGIYNAGILNVNGDGDGTTYTGTVKLYSISDTGTTNIYGGTVNVAKDLTQKAVTVASGATLTTNGNVKTTDGIANAGTLNLLGGKKEGSVITYAVIDSTVSGDGTTEFGTGIEDQKSYIQTNGAISQAVTIKQHTNVIANAEMGAEAKNIINYSGLTISADNVKGDIINGPGDSSSVLTLTEGTLTRQITGGKNASTIISDGKVIAQNTIQQARLSIDNGATLETDANNLVDIGWFFNQGNLNLTGGTLSSNVFFGNGTTNIESGIVNVIKDITQKAVTVANGATLTTKGNVTTTDGITNAGTLNLTGTSAVINSVINGENGITNFGNGTNNAYIEVQKAISQAINIQNGAWVVANADIGLTGKAFNIEENAALDIAADNIKADIVNKSLELIINDGIDHTSGIISTKITGDGATTLAGKDFFIAENGLIDQDLHLSGTLTTNADKLGDGHQIVGSYGDFPAIVNLTGGILKGSIIGPKTTITDGSSVGIANDYYIGNLVLGNNSTLNQKNNSTGVLNIGILGLTSNNNLMLDADLAGEKMDQLSVMEISGSNTLKISDINLLSDADDDYVELSLFADGTTTDVYNKVSGNLNGLKYSTIYKYDALYDSATGMIGFTRYNSGSSDDFNPYLYAPSGVANTTAAMTTQIAALAMDKMDDVVHAQGRSGGDTPSLSNAWVRVMGLNDNVEFNNFENIDSKALTVTAGYNTNKITCGDCGIVFGAYAGYIGGKQQYTGNDIDQDGGYIGLSSALTLRNAFLTATVNGGLLKNKANNMYGSDRFNTLWLGAGLKTGYNFAITDSVVLQPNVYGGYTLVNTQDYTSVSGVKIATNNLNFFEIDPGLKLSAVIADGWIGSVQGKYAIVMDNGANITANDFALQNISPKNYFEYGIGIDKSLTDAFYLGAKVNRHDGGRTGWNGSIEFRYKF